MTPADSGGSTGRWGACILPTIQHTAFFAREKYRVTIVYLIYLLVIWAYVRQTDTTKSDSKCIKKCLTTGRHMGSSRHSPRPLEGGYQMGKKEQRLSPATNSWICHCRQMTTISRQWHRASIGDIRWCWPRHTHSGTVKRLIETATTQLNGQNEQRRFEWPEVQHSSTAETTCVIRVSARKFSSFSSHHS